MFCHGDTAPRLQDSPPLEAQRPQTKACNVLVFLGCEATDANPPPDATRLRVEDHQPALCPFVTNAD
jgi:hypothetical protein